MKKGNLLLIVLTLAFLATILFNGCTNKDQEIKNQIALIEAQGRLVQIKGDNAKNTALLTVAQTDSIRAAGDFIEKKSRADIQKQSELRSTLVIFGSMIVLIFIIIVVFISWNKITKENRQLHGQIATVVALASPFVPEIASAARKSLLPFSGDTKKNQKSLPQNVQPQRTQPQIAESSVGSGKISSLSIDMCDDV